MTRLSHRIWRFATIVPLLSFAFISCKTTQQTRTPIAKPPSAMSRSLGLNPRCRCYPTLLPSLCCR